MHSIFGWLNIPCFFLWKCDCNIKTIHPLPPHLTFPFIVNKIHPTNAQCTSRMCEMRPQIHHILLLRFFGCILFISRCYYFPLIYKYKCRNETESVTHSHLSVVFRCPSELIFNNKEMMHSRRQCTIYHREIWLRSSSGIP